jgi:hypothetical protein
MDVPRLEEAATLRERPRELGGNHQVVGALTIAGLMVYATHFNILLSKGRQNAHPIYLYNNYI